MKPNVCILMALMVLGCAGSPAAVRTASQDPFPLDRYLTAEAGGSGAAAARQAAMAELAAVFEARVHARTLQQARAWSGEGLSEQFDREVAQTIRIQTDVRLEGARIGRTWKDASTGEFRALAVLDRRQAARRWERELADVRMMVDGQVRALDSAHGRLTQLAALNRIAASQVREAVIESRLSVLGQPAMPVERDFADITARRETLAHSISLAVRLAGEPAPPFTRRLTARLTAEGYRIAADTEQAAGLITGTIQTQVLDLGNPEVHFIRALADVQLVDADTGTRIAAVDETVRKAHVDAQEAARRAIDGVARQVAGQLVRALGTLGVAPGPDTTSQEDS